jgi:hypothetical protein
VVAVSDPDAINILVLAIARHLCGYAFNGKGGRGGTILA